MKTAMELMLWYLENEGLQESGVYYKAKMLLEKEKDQRIKDFQNGMQAEFDIFYKIATNQNV
jgi:hypothetical protein